MLAVACTKGFVNSTENGKIFFRLPRKNHQNGEWQAVAGPAGGRGWQGVGGSGSQWCWGKQAKNMIRFHLKICFHLKMILHV